MLKKIVSVCLVLILCAGVIAAAVLNYNGLLSFMHPLKTAAPMQIKVACVGDSVTYGFGIQNRAKNCYPAVLQTLLGDGYCVNNYGYSGRTVSTKADRPYVAEKLYRQSLDFQPDIVVFMLGSNDSKPFNWNKAQFASDYRAIVESFRALDSQPQIYIVIPTPVYPVNGEVNYHIDGDILQNEIVPLTRQLANELELPVIDVNTPFLDHPELFSDGCHPNQDGAMLYAQLVQQAIETNQ
ncbi:MAG: hypothetical protein IJU56_02710 [Clostridia bacterium]|nr:hypothetical protein [Clostridia bacterium]